MIRLSPITDEPTNSSFPVFLIRHSPNNEDSTKIEKFFNLHKDDYILWLLRAFLKGKDSWTKLDETDLNEDIRKKASAMLLAVLGDAALWVCASQISNLIKMLAMRDNRFVSVWTAFRISVWILVCMKRLMSKNDDISTNIETRESLFAYSLKIFGPDKQILIYQKALLLVAGMGMCWQLESIVPALRKKDANQIS